VGNKRTQTKLNQQIRCRSPRKVGGSGSFCSSMRQPKLGKRRILTAALMVCMDLCLNLTTFHGHRWKASLAQFTGRIGGEHLVELCKSVVHQDGEQLSWFHLRNGDTIVVNERPRREIETRMFRIARGKVRCGFDQPRSKTSVKLQCHVDRFTGRNDQGLVQRISASTRCVGLVDDQSLISRVADLEWHAPLLSDRRAPEIDDIGGHVQRCV